MVHPPSPRRTRWPPKSRNWCGSPRNRGISPTATFTRSFRRVPSTPELLDAVYARLQASGNRDRGPTRSGLRPRRNGRGGGGKQWPYWMTPCGCILSRWVGGRAHPGPGSGDFPAHRDRGAGERAEHLWLGFAGKEHIALAEKLLAEPPGNAMTASSWKRRSRAATGICAGCTSSSAGPGTGPAGGPPIRHCEARNHRDDALAVFRGLDHTLQAAFPEFYFKQKVIEEMALVAENIHDNLQYSLRALATRNGRANPTREGIGRGRTAEDPGPGGICPPAPSRNI